MAYYSNSTEGEILDNQCSDCKFGDKPCPIAAAQLIFNYDSVGNDIAEKILNTIVSDSKGCMMFISFKKDLKR